jgi:hypothetical protein
MHALDRVAVAHQVTPDDIRHRGVVVDDDDPPWRIGVAHQRIFPFLDKRKWLRLHGKT